MSQKGYKIYRICPRCGGTGKLYKTTAGGISEIPINNIPPDVWNEIVCPTCNGLTIIFWGWMTDEKYETMPSG